MDGARFSDDDINLLSTGLAALYRGSPHRGTTAIVCCADGKFRHLTQERAVEIITALCELSGKKAGITLEQAREIAKEANR